MSERSELISRLSKEKALRGAYVRSKVSTNIASQVRALRRREDLTQSEFAELTEMKQSRISAMEKPDTRLAVETLVRVAAALKMGLIVRFSSFSDMLRWENEFNQDTFRVTKLDSDADFIRSSDSARRSRRRPRVRGTSRLLNAVISAPETQVSGVSIASLGNTLETTASPRQAQWLLPFNVTEMEKTATTVRIPDSTAPTTAAAVGGNYGR